MLVSRPRIARLAALSLAVTAFACAPGTKYNPNGPDINLLGTPARGDAYTAGAANAPQSNPNPSPSDAPAPRGR
jgi:hypothetical protein